jgi:hypothetical protein
MNQRSGSNPPADPGARGEPEYDGGMTNVRTKEPEHVEDEYDLTEEEEAELEESMAQIERGEYVDWDDIREERRRHQS